MNNYFNNTANTQNTVVSETAFSKLMRNVYAWMCAGLLMTALTAMGVAKNAELFTMLMTNKLLFWGIMIAEIALVIYLSARIMRMSFFSASLCFAAYSILNGVTMSFIFMAYTTESIAQTFLITAGTFGAMSLVGFFIKKDLSGLGRMLIMLLIGLIIASVINIFLASSTMAVILNYLGVIIFVGLTAYDTQKIKQMLQYSSYYGISEQTQKMALLGSLTLYLDFINMFLYLLRIFGNRE
jgi:FtsH-binding integral membrane protein